MTWNKGVLFSWTGAGKNTRKIDFVTKAKDQVNSQKL
jgi:hypothetical protein